ncbi:MAG: hypothetical protein KHY67_08115 [Collinsella intestinalis]|jgi:hypothetical protein|uniref:Helix-turn-helix type 11 domain-containing protein n=1 Tax=Collinsella intestinalis TaxID=147207 RepID=A0A943BPV4_9ACTN|nr:hypothetical protein [Collinsella intestinalis]
MATVKDLADKLGVSKPTIVKQLDALGLREDHAAPTGPRGALEIDSFAASAIADAILKTRTDDEPDDRAENATDRESRAFEDEGAISVYRDYVSSLKSALSDSNSRYDRLAAELDQKNAQIERLQRQLETANKTIEKLSTRSWFDRMFNRGLPERTSEES